MKVLLLAAGQGQRMRPKSLDCPKPLLQCGQHRLIEYHLYQLAAAGFEEIIINVSYRSQDFKPILGDGQRYGLHIEYSHEPQPCYETAGAVIHALPMLGDAPFLMISSDIYTDFAWHSLHHQQPDYAHLILRAPTQLTSQGDFHLEQGKITGAGAYLYANIGVFNPSLFRSWPLCRLPLRRVLQAHLRQPGRITGACWSGRWHNLSTPSQLAALHQQLLSE